MEFDPERMAKRDWLQKGADVTSRPTTHRLAGLREWLTPDAVLRVLFFGAARRDLAIGVTTCRSIRRSTRPTFGASAAAAAAAWIPHVDPHDCSAACMSMQLDTCSLVCGWYEAPKRSWRGVIKLSDANAFSPDPSWLGFPIIALLSGTVNYELIFVLPQLVAPTPRSQSCACKSCAMRS